MAKPMLKPLGALVLSLIPVLLQGQAPTPTPDPCTNVPANADFHVNAGNPPHPTTQQFGYTLKNDTDVLIRLENINPYALKCSVTTTVTPVNEGSISSFLGLIGGVTGSVGATTPAPGATPTPSASPSPTPTPTPSKRKPALLAVSPTPTPKPCPDQYRSKREQVESLISFRDNINHALVLTQENQNDALVDFSIRLATLRGQSACSSIVSQAMQLGTRPVFAVSQVDVPYDPAVPRAQGAPDTAATPMDQAIDQLAARAQKLLPHLADDLDAGCKKELQPVIDADTAFLGALINNTSSVPSAVSTWTSQLKAFNAVRGNFRSAQISIINALGERRNFTLDTSIHGKQQVVTYTASCTPVTLVTVAAPDIIGGSPAPSPSPSPTPTPTPPPVQPWSHDFNFGGGPRFALAGGLVVSPLQQVTFNTTATPGGSGATANTIIQQQNSSTRILPIAMLHTRYWDLLPVKKFKHDQWIPNYISVGVTAKSTDTIGTNVEYLFGPSWAFADRQFFLTAGAYAGKQQRLANVGTPPLAVGSTTSLSSANLPITQTTIWKPGFALTWAPGGK